MSIMEALFDQEEVTRRYMLRVEKEAIERGMEKGMEKGMEEQSCQIARNMIADNMPVDVIVKYTGLSPERIEELADRQTV